MSLKNRGNNIKINEFTQFIKKISYFLSKFTVKTYFHHLIFHDFLLFWPLGKELAIIPLQGSMFQSLAAGVFSKVNFCKSIFLDIIYIYFSVSNVIVCFINSLHRKDPNRLQRLSNCPFVIFKYHICFNC